MPTAPSPRQQRWPRPAALHPVHPARASLGGASTRLPRCAWRSRRGHLFAPGRRRRAAAPPPSWKARLCQYSIWTLTRCLHDRQHVRSALRVADLTGPLARARPDRRAHRTLHHVRRRSRWLSQGDRGSARQTRPPAPSAMRWSAPPRLSFAYHHHCVDAGARPLHCHAARPAPACWVPADPCAGEAARAEYFVGPDWRRATFRDCHTRKTGGGDERPRRVASRLRGASDTPGGICDLRHQRRCTRPQS